MTPATGRLDRAAVRAELGYAEDERVCIVAVGGSGVGIDLLRRVLASYSRAKTLVPALRMIVVCGPRIDPSSLSAPEGVEVQQYVHELYRHLAVCDVAVVQGGLTTSMELVAAKTPFLYFPLRDHFEQNFHVRHRLTPVRRGALPRHRRRRTRTRSPRRSRQPSRSPSSTGTSRRVEQRVRPS